MSIIAIAVKHLMNAGVTGDALVMAIEEMESSTKSEKSSAAIRQKRYRDRNALRNVNNERNEASQTVTQPPSASFPFPLLSPTPPNNPLPQSSPSLKITRDIFILPDWVPVEAWNAWLEIRKGKAKNTCRALTIAVNKLQRLANQGHDPTSVLEQSTMSGYPNLYGIKEDANRNSNSKQPLSKTSDSLAALYRAGNRIRDDAGMESAETG